MADLVLSGNTSGAITISAPSVAGTNTITLPANTGTVITTASSGQVIPKAALPTGSVLQVVTATYATGTSTTSSTYTDLGMTASITPTSSTSKVLVIVSVQGLYLPSGGNNNDCISIKLLRGSTDINIMAGQTLYRGATSVAQCGNTYGIYTDSPATTSSTTYKLQWRTENSRPVNMNVGGETSTFTLMEIAA